MPEQNAKEIQFETVQILLLTLSFFVASNEGKINS